MRKIVDKSMLGNTWVLGYEDNDNNGDLIKKILKNRGVCDEESIQKFLNPSIKEYMPDPSVLMDMDKAANIIADAVQAKRKIAIYGDYDVDGITSTAVFVKYLREIGCDVIWHLPTREGEGYGLNNVAIKEIERLVNVPIKYFSANSCSSNFLVISINSNLCKYFSSSLVNKSSLSVLVGNTSLSKIE